MKVTTTLLLTVLATGLCAQEGVEQAKAALDKWYDLQKLISKEENEWRIGRELMQDRVELIKKESQVLQEKIEKTKQESAENDKKLEELRKQNETLKQGLEPLTHDIKMLELRVLAMVTRTPEAVRQRVSPLTQRISTSSGASKLSLSERYQNVIGVLNELNKVAREISLASEVRQLKDGRKVEVTVLYLGLSQAYYVNEKSRVAGVGQLDEGGVWRWEERDDLADAVTQVLGIYKGEKPAAYVPIAVKIQ
jgi:septal ring factor EnvC (AmiA/AmiB activator)